MNPKQKTIAWLGGGVALMVVGTLVMFVLARNWKFEPPPKLVISKETTYLTGPLHANGGIDWVAALEAEARAGGWSGDERSKALLEELIEAADLFREGSRHQREEEDLQEMVESALGEDDPEAEEPDEDDEASRDDPSSAAFDSLLQYEFGETLVRETRRRLEEAAPGFRKLREAAAAPSCLMGLVGREPADQRRFLLFQHVAPLTEALTVRMMDRARQGGVEGALEDAAIAGALVPFVGVPATTAAHADAANRAAAQIALLLRAVRAGKLPADRVLAIVEAPTGRAAGEAAWREALRGDRIAATRELEESMREDDHDTADADPSKRTRKGQNLLRALRSTDPNPRFRELQRSFDARESVLFESTRPARERLVALHAELEAQVKAIDSTTRRTKLLSMLFPVPDETLAELHVVFETAVNASIVLMSHRYWIGSVARRDARLAELSLRAGAPSRRDSWLGEPLIAERKEGGSIEVTGALIDLARELDPDYDRLLAEEEE